MAEIRIPGAKSPLFTLPDLEIDEFIPVVQVDPVNFKSGKKAAHFKGEKKDLSPLIDENLRTVEMDVVIAVPGDMVVTCTVAKGRRGTLDYDGIINTRVAGQTQGVKVKAADNGKASYGAPFEILVEIVGSQERTFRIELYANDDSYDANAGEFSDVLCGCLEVRTWPDVFSGEDARRLIGEMEFIAPFDKAGEPEEYSGLYCMHAAERGLSMLLENHVDFYSVDRSHRKLNGISLEGQRAGLRGDYFLNSGFVIKKIEENGYSIDKKLLAATKSEEDYKDNMYDVVGLPPGSRLSRELRQTIEGKPGFHVFYLSVSDDFHTLILIVDTRDSSRRGYEIYDQEGRTSSHGPLVDLETGLERQTSWTFLRAYMDKGFDPDKTIRTTTRLWKIQRKH